MKRFILLFCLLCSLRATGHEVRPAYLELTEVQPGRFDVLWKVPAMGAPPLAGEDLPHETGPVPSTDPATAKTMPCGCPVPSGLHPGVLPVHPTLPPLARAVSPVREERLPGALIRRWTVDTGGAGLSGHSIRIHGLESTMIDVLVRLTFSGGQTLSRLLRPESPSFTVDGAPDSIAKDYLILGVEHILSGADHLLFVLGLLLIVRDLPRLVKTITAFTLSHSITLGLATLGCVSVPAAPLEAIIALSILFVAREAALHRDGTPSFTGRKPWLVAFSFGLLHGFGFAGALREVGLPPNAIPAALLFFNLGVELGQLAFVAAVLTVIRQARKLSRTPAHFPPPRARLAAPYAIGGMAAFWVIQRLMAF